MIQFTRPAATAPQPAAMLAILESRAAEFGARRRRLVRSQQLDIPDQENGVLIVVTGSLSVATPTEDGREAFLSDVKPGEMVGEAFALGNGNLPLTVTAVDATEIWSMRREAYRRALSLSPDFAAAAMDAMCRRQCRANLRMAESATLDVAHRLAAELRRLAAESENGLTIARLPTHRELAVRIASHREAVTKELSRLERARSIRRDGHRLELTGASWKTL